jgi:hypothetical protein
MTLQPRREMLMIFVSHPSELTVKSYQGSMLVVMNILSKVSHNAALNTTMNEHNDGDGYKEGLFMSLVSQQWLFSSSACAD